MISGYVVESSPQASHSNTFSDAPWTKTDATVGTIKTSWYETYRGNMLENFESSADWIVTGIGTTVVDNTTQYICGTQSVKLNAIGINAATMEKIINWDLSSVNNFVLWLYVENISNTVSNIGIQFSSTADFSKYMNGSIAYTQLRNGWNRILLYKKDTWVSVNGDTWSNKMVRVKFILIPKPFHNISVSFADLRTNYASSKAKIIITFDDNRTSVYEKAYPMMKANNQVGCIGVVTDGVGSVLPHESAIKCSTLEQIKKMYNDGWDVVNHSKTHVDLTTLPALSLNSEVNDAYNYLVSNGFGKSAKFFIYPEGRYNSNVISKVKENHVWARTVKVSPEQNPQITRYNDMEFETSATYVKNKTTLVQAERSVDRIINSGGCVIFIFHGIVDSNPGTWEWLTSDFQSLSKYIKTKMDASQVDVETLSTYFNSFINTSDGNIRSKLMGRTNYNLSIKEVRTRSSSLIN